MKQNTLLLASSSASRQQLLRDAQIPFQLVTQTADETKCDWGLPLQQVVGNIARYKMEHVVLPHGTDGDICYVLTADTLSEDSAGAISGKPVDRADAVEKIKAARNGMRTGTAFWLDKKRYRNGLWEVEQRVERYVEARYQFVIPDHWIETYLEKSVGLACSGAIAIEGYGGLFLRSVEGSYTTIVGLPLFELREALEEVGFF
ncbi:MAG: Maf family protein [Candidatus Babeliales bacterium]